MWCTHCDRESTFVLKSCSAIIRELGRHGFYQMQSSRCMTCGREFSTPEQRENNCVAERVARDTLKAEIAMDVRKGMEARQQHE